MINQTKKYRRFNHHHEIRPDQAFIKIDGQQFIADKKMIPLLRALNAAGLKTRSHCAGHKDIYSFLCLILDPETSIEIRPVSEIKSTRRFPAGTQELCIQWKRSARKT